MYIPLTNFSFLNCTIFRRFSFSIVLLFFTVLAQSVYAQDDAAATADVAAGEKLFKDNCLQCHSTGANRVVGPGLKGINEKHEFEWLAKWIRNSQAMIAAGDEEAIKIAKEYNNLQMTAFPNMTDDQIGAMLAYVDHANETAAAAAPAGGGGSVAAGGAASSGPSDLFVVVLVALLVVMVLVLAVLLVLISIVKKSVGGEDADQSSSKGPGFGVLLKNVANNSAIRTATVFVFVLLVVKTLIDGAYNVGVQQGYAPKQPIAFSHKLHAGEYGIDCNYCHTGVNKGRAATIPSANICMNCHSSIKKESPEIQKIYKSIENNEPIEWVRVHNLPDLAYFNHSQHVNVAGLDCENCHGDVKSMEVVEQRSTLTMGWCIDCHRQTDVNTKGNAYYDKLVQVHEQEGKGTLKVEDIGGLECSKCHY